MILDLLLYAKIPIGEIFASGYISSIDISYDSSSKVKPVKWIAIRYNRIRWQILIGDATFTNDNLLLFGKKVTIPADIKNIVLCDNEVFELYNR